jgi:acetyl/propionyl-CoA carboxylase alpha subunit
MIQVAGIPTNLQFLQRLSAHPAFMAVDDLDTGQLSKNHENLQKVAQHFALIQQNMTTMVFLALLYVLKPS